MNRLCLGAIVCMIWTGSAAVLPAAESTGTVTAEMCVAPSTAAPAGVAEINAAVCELNYRIEYLTSRYVEVSNELEDLRRANQAQDKAISEQRAARAEFNRIKNLEMELDLIRTELARVREEAGTAESRESVRRKEQAEQDELPAWMPKWVRSPWVPVSSLGLAFLAFIIAL